MDEIDRILEDQGINKSNMEAALEFARLTAEATGLCCGSLGRFAWECFQKLESEDEETE